MFLHALSRRLSANWHVRIDGEEYGRIVAQWFNHQCPYCLRDLTAGESVIEHLDGMNRYRAGLHVAGNVLVACRKCNGEKRRDDSLRILSLAESGWASFLSHDGSRCAPSCATCRYWKGIWNDDEERNIRLSQNLQRIRSFRNEFREFEQILSVLQETLPSLLTKLYADCQTFAENEIKSLLDRFDQVLSAHVQKDYEAQ